MAYRPGRTIDSNPRGPSQQEEESSISYNRTSNEMFLRTNRIQLSTANAGNPGIDIKIEYSLNLHPTRAGQFFTWLQEQARTLPQGLGPNNGIGSLFEVVFIIVDDRSESLLENLYTSQTRMEIIDNFENNQLLAHARANSGILRIPLLEVLRSSRDLEYRTGATEMGGQTYYETYSEATINYRPSNQGDFNGDGDFYASYTSNNLHLVGFLMAPRDPAIVGLRTRNTDLVYDLLLTRNAIYSYGPQGDLNLEADNLQNLAGSLKVPLVRSIYYVNDDSPEYEQINLKPYSGPVFREGFDQPAVFRAGTPNSPGPIVTMTTIRQRKVFSDNLYRFAFLPRSPLGHNFDLSLYGASDSLMANAANPMNLGTFGSQAEKLSRNKANLSKALLDNNEYESSFVTPNTPSHVWRAGPPATQNPDGSFSRHTRIDSLIGIKILDLLTQNTPFKTLLANLRLEDNNMTRSILYSICSNSKIIDLTVFRRRVGNSPNSHNDQDTKLYYDFEENQQKIALISASDSFSEGSDPITAGINVSSNGVRKILNGPMKGDDSVSMVEVRIAEDDLSVSSYGSQDRIAQANEVATYDRGGPISTFLTLASNNYFSEYNRTFYLMDKEIASINTGKYTYDVQLTLRDGTKDAILERLHNFKDKISEISEIRNLISTPVIRNSNGAIVSGIFDYTMNRLRVSQISDVQVETTDATIGSTCEMYRDLLFILTGTRTEPPIAAEESRMRLLLSNRTTKPQDYDYFIDQCLNLVRKMEEFLASIYFINPEEAVGNTEKVHVPNSTGLTTNVIVKEVNTGIVIDTEDSTRMLADFGLNPEIDDFIESVRRRAFAASTLTPNLPGYGEVLEGDFPTFTESAPLPPRRTLEVLPEEFFTYESEQLVLADSLEDAKITVLDNGVVDTLDEVDMSNANVGFPRISNPPRFASRSLNVVTGLVTNSIKLEEFNTLPAFQKSNQESIIFTMMQPQSHIYGFQDKDSSFHARYSQMSNSQMSVSLSGFDNSSSLKGITQQALKASNLAMDYLTEDLERAIIDSLEANTGPSRFQTKIQDNFEELVKIKDKLGDFYVEFNRILSDNKLIIKDKQLYLNFEDKFKQGLGDKPASIKMDSSKTPFQQKAAVMTTTNLDGTARILSSEETLKMLNKKPFKVEDISSVKVVKVLKLEQTGKQDNIANVNDVALMEIF